MKEESVRSSKNLRGMRNVTYMNYINRTQFKAHNNNNTKVFNLFKSIINRNYVFIDTTKIVLKNFAFIMNIW